MGFHWRDKVNVMGRTWPAMGREPGSGTYGSLRVVQGVAVACFVFTIFYFLRGCDFFDVAAGFNGLQVSAMHSSTSK